MSFLPLASLSYAQEPGVFRPAATNVWGAESHIGGFSGAGGPLVLGGQKLDPKTASNGAFADPVAFAKKVKLLWLGVGTDEPDALLPAAPSGHAQATSVTRPRVRTGRAPTIHERPVSPLS